jgi:hypothetical protein
VYGENDIQRFGYTVCDGTQWELEFEYNNGHKPVRFDGDNSHTRKTSISSKCYLALTILRRKRMSKFDVLTKYIPIVQADSIGEWIIDTALNGVRNL